MARSSRDYDESDVRIRPNRRGSRPRTKDRPAHADAVPGRVLGVDRGRYRVLVGDGADAPRRHGDAGPRARPQGDRRRRRGPPRRRRHRRRGQPGPDRAGRRRGAPCCAARPTTPTPSSGCSSPTPTSSSSSPPWPTPSRARASSTAASSRRTTPGWSRSSSSPRPTSPTRAPSSSSYAPLAVRHVVTAPGPGRHRGPGRGPRRPQRARQRPRGALRRRQVHPRQRPGPRRPARHRGRQRRHGPGPAHVVLGRRPPPARRRRLGRRHPGGALLRAGPRGPDPDHPPLPGPRAGHRRSARAAAPTTRRSAPSTRGSRAGPPGRPGRPGSSRCAGCSGRGRPRARTEPRPAAVSRGHPSARVVLGVLDQEAGVRLAVPRRVHVLRALRGRAVR